MPISVGGYSAPADFKRKTITQVPTWWAKVEAEWDNLGKRMPYGGGPGADGQTYKSTHGLPPKGSTSAGRHHSPSAGGAVAWLQTWNSLLACAASAPANAFLDGGHYDRKRPCAANAGAAGIDLKQPRSRGADGNRLDRLLSPAPFRRFSLWAHWNRAGVNDHGDSTDRDGLPMRRTVRRPR